MNRFKLQYVSLRLKEVSFVKLISGNGIVVIAKAYDIGIGHIVAFDIVHLISLFIKYASLMIIDLIAADICGAHCADPDTALVCS